MKKIIEVIVSIIAIIAGLLILGFAGAVEENYMTIREAVKDIAICIFIVASCGALVMNMEERA